MGDRFGGSFHDGHSDPTGPALIGLGKGQALYRLPSDRPWSTFAMTAAPAMSLLPRKNILTIAAVIDIALNTGDGPVSPKEVAARHHLPMVKFPGQRKGRVASIIVCTGPDAPARGGPQIPPSRPE
jgi:hypothetical protein